MLVELQRADGKAATLCALASGTLVAAVSTVSTWSNRPAPLAAAVLCGCVLLLAAALSALVAIRPSLPKGRTLADLEALPLGSVAASHAADPAEPVSPALIEMEAQRLRRLTGLAERKYRAVRTSVDLTVAAGMVTGIGLLISCTN